MNIPAILNVFKVIRDPSLCVPHYTIANFNQLPIPLSSAFRGGNAAGPAVDIRAVVLDKDNCFATPNENSVYPAYNEKFQELVKTYKSANILIVSNSTGLKSTDPAGQEADLLERNTGVTVLRHSVRKPACSAEILAHFKGRVESASQIAVIGDRLFTDVVMANMMGAHSIWIREGVVHDRGLVTRLEYGLAGFLAARGFKPPPRL